ncbi:MAG: hypothetical protein ACRDJU_12785, partial [Actinomycetota bacterium]
HQLPAPLSQGVRDSVTVQGSTIYFLGYGNTAGGVDAQAKIAVSTDGGLNWQPIHDPCGPTPSGATGESDATALAAGPGGAAAVLCQPRLAPSTQFLVTRASTGASFGGPVAIPVPAGGEVAAVGVGSASDIALAVQGPGSAFSLLVSRDGGSSWHTGLVLDVSTAGASPPPTVVYRGTSTIHVTMGTPQLWTSTDSGSSWQSSAPD